MYEAYQPPGFRLLPEAVKHLLILNGLVFMAQTLPVLEGVFLRYGALWHPLTGLFLPWQLVTSLFLHGGIAHLFFNMLALWMFGAPLENFWGSRRFVLYYFLCGSGAMLTHLIVTTFWGDPTAPVIGASGAVFGLLLGFGLLFPNQYIYLYFLLPIKAKYFVILYGLLELWAGVAAGPSDHVARFAHLGGMLWGYALIRIWTHQARRRYRAWQQMYEDKPVS
ncbi:MAG: rhomboid family intramembrane serine protease [Bacteroidota bacterium]|nr:rhomboid family intramembrane serine protease [Bacteroidota bacterium]MDW8137107.1 rhomboid family intramembrane serine protease [Bacteroidota bacterium]